MSKKENIMIDTEQRLFYLSDEIDNTSIGTMCFNLLRLLQSDDEQEEKEKNFKRQPIKIYINSYGGTIYDMWSLIDIIINSKTPIYTYCLGYAMSAGFMIFLAGHKRFIGKNATLLYHQLSGGQIGKYTDIKQNIGEYDRVQADIEIYVINRTKISKEKIIEIREKKIDWYIHSENAIDYGIADEVI